MKTRGPSTRPLPCLHQRGKRADHLQPGVLFAVYAPFGADPSLSGYPDDTLRPIDQHPLVGHLKSVAALGINVAALIDLADDDTWLVEIPAWRPGKAVILSAWKQAMNQPQALSGFLRRAHARFPCSALVLALEGHGAGFLPEVDRLRITPSSTAQSQDGEELVWQVGSGASRLAHNDGSPILPMTGFEVLPMTGFEVLPAHAPDALPVTMPLSTWAVAKALADSQKAGVPRPAVIHFNNCFNMALEHLHTVAPYAEVATGYANYNYFTGGQTYPLVFGRLAGAANPVNALTLGRWFAEENHRPLALQGGNPGVGATISLRQVPKLAEAVEKLASELTSRLRSQRATHFPRIRDAIGAALQFDTQGDFLLEVPDQSTDLGTWCLQLQQQYPAPDDVFTLAAQVLSALKNVQVYGDKDQPYMGSGQTWDFSNPRVAISIMIPDPRAEGLLDWRAPYYMAGTVDPKQPPAMKAQVPFLADRAGGVQAPWPEFIDEYHKVDPFPAIRLLRIAPFKFPVYDAERKGGTPGTPGPDEPRDPVGSDGKPKRR